MTYKKKLIEVALPLAAISDASASEKLVKRGKPSSVHLWWARRPFVSARAVLWASLVDDPSGHPDRFPTLESQQLERDRLFEVLERLVQWDNSMDEGVLAEARAEIDASCSGNHPTIVDPFGGGATIPLESMRLGLNTVSGDLNPVATLIQRGMLSLPYRFSDLKGVHPNASMQLSGADSRSIIADDLVQYGEDLRDIVLKKLTESYPPVRTPNGRSLTPLAWIWARTVESPDPSWPGHVPLVGSWLLKSKSPRVWVEAIVDRERFSVSYAIREGGEIPAGTVNRSGAVCLATGAPIPFSYIRSEAMAGRLGSTLIAIVAEGDRQRVYLPPADEHTEASSLAQPTWIPEAKLQGKARQNVSLYGMDTFADLFSTRQLATLSRLVDALSGLRTQIEADAVEAGLADDHQRFRDGGAGAAAYADALITYLAFAIDRLADWNNSLCRWENKAQVPQQLFGRHSMAMVWDFAEANIFSKSTGSLSATLKTLATAIRALCHSQSVRRALSTWMRGPWWIRLEHR